ncbi:uncharacterized protein [Cherax quadricarinatus]
MCWRPSFALITPTLLHIYVSLLNLYSPFYIIMGRTAAPVVRDQYHTWMIKWNWRPQIATVVVVVVVVASVIEEGVMAVDVEDIEVATSSQECQHSGRTLICDAKDRTKTIHLRTSPGPEVEKVFLYNARKVEVWSSVCVDLEVKQVEHVVTVEDEENSGKSTNNCDNMGMWSYKSSLYSLPPAVNHLYAEHSTLWNVSLEALGGDLTLISCHVKLLQINQTVEQHTLRFHSSVIDSNVRLHLGNQASLYIYNTTIQELHPRALVASGSAFVHLSGGTGMKTPHDIVVLQPGALVNISEYEGDVRFVVQETEEDYRLSTPSIHQRSSFSDTVVYILFSIVCLLLLVLVCLCVLWRKYCANSAEVKSRTLDKLQTSEEQPLVSISSNTPSQATQASSAQKSPTTSTSNNQAIPKLDAAPNEQKKQPVSEVTNTYLPFRSIIQAGYTATTAATHHFLTGGEEPPTDHSKTKHPTTVSHTEVRDTK